MSAKTANPYSEAALIQLHQFLHEVAGLKIQAQTPAVHYNAFVLLRRGYKVEEITENEYLALARLMVGIEQPDIQDDVLHETGSHRAVYKYLTRKLGLDVEKGRGPAWHRAKRLMEAYKAKHTLRNSVEFGTS